MSKIVTEHLLNQYDHAFASDRGNRIAQDAVSANGLFKSCQNPEVIRKSLHTFSLTLNQGNITNQKQSGRCWLFAAMNVMRMQVMKTCNLENFELSQNYMLFWDKLEKCNWFFENILDTLDEPVGSRILDHLLAAPIGDGGQWDMMANLVQKYGVIPKYAMPETAVSGSTREMNRIITEYLRNGACLLREAAKKEKQREPLEEMKEHRLEDIYRMLCICLPGPASQNL